LSGLQITLAALLLIAAVSKIAYPQQILAALRQSSLPDWLAPWAPDILIVCEIESALLLLVSTGWFLSVAFLWAFTLLGIFTVWILWVLRQNLRVSCGCFGPSLARVNQKYLVRNGSFLVLALGGVFLSLITRSAFPGPPVWMILIGSLFFPGVAVVLLQTRRNQITSQARIAA
jgi:hypothetical protein